MRAGCGRAPCLCRCWIGCCSNCALALVQYVFAIFGGYTEAVERSLSDMVSPRALPAVQVTAGMLFA